MPETEKDRLKHLRKDLLHLSGEKFGASLGVGKTAISSIENGVNGLTDQMIKTICSVYGVDETWLRTGEGDPFIQRSQNEQIEEWVNRVMADRDEAFRKKFMIALSNVSDEGWCEIYKFVTSILKDE